ncbi:MAG: S1 RNA-binding domain-containing protein [Patescibacteria group bacterium]
MQQVLETIKKQVVPGINDIVEGELLKKERRMAFVDLGELGTGIILGREFLSSQDKIKNLNPGDKVAAKIIGLVDENGFWELSLNQADKEAGWKKVQSAKNSKEDLVLPVSGANQGGLLMQYEEVEGFLPVSQLSIEHYPRVEGGDKAKILEELKSFVGKELKVRVLDFSPEEGKLIFSEKEAEQERLQNLISRYKINDIVEGEITGLAPFGAFIKFGEPTLEGLIHISEIDHKLVEDPAEYFQIGDKTKAEIINIADDRVFLSLKSLKPDPWESIEKKYLKGETYPGRVVKSIQQGVLVSLDEYIYGICETEKELKPEKTYQFKISQINKKEKKIDLELTE